MAKFIDLLGQFVKNIYYDEETHILTFVCSQGTYIMYHEQDCCEHVYLEDVCGGELNDLVNEIVVYVSEQSNYTDTGDGDCLWTFYTISTINTTLTLRWCGISNGYYSIGVNFKQVFEC